MVQKIDFSGIYGQDAAVGHLQNALRSGHISHAYIICGERGSGRMQLAQTFARTLQCQHRVERNGLIEACGECHSCIQAAAGSHPDILTIIPQDPGSNGAIRINEARARIKDDVLIKPYSSDWKIYIIPDADKMNVETQNMLLKTLEEPPSYAVLILLAQTTQNFLPTILSRCITLRLSPVKIDLIAQQLTRDGIPADKARLCAALSHGNPGRAAFMAEDEAYWQLRQESIRFLEGLTDMDTYTILTFCTPLTRSQVDDFLDICESWVRDLAVVRYTRDKTQLIFRDEEDYLGSAGAHIWGSQIQRCMNAISLAHQRRKANGNDVQVLEMLLLSMRSALRGRRRK